MPREGLPSGRAGMLSSKHGAVQPDGKAGANVGLFAGRSGQPEGS